MWYSVKIVKCQQCCTPPHCEVNNVVSLDWSVVTLKQTLGFYNNGRGPSWLWSYHSWIYNYLCNQCLSPLTLWIQIPLRRCVLDITLCDIVCQWLAASQWFSPGTPVSSTNKTDRHDITEILLKVAIKTITLTPTIMVSYHSEAAIEVLQSSH